jgi:DNA invertase Pin-like site-specific DNA recombinase
MAAAAAAIPGELSDDTFSSLRHWGRVASSTGNDPKSFSQRKLIQAMLTGQAEGATQREIARAARCAPATVGRHLRKAAATEPVASPAALPAAKAAAVAALPIAA